MTVDFDVLKSRGNEHLKNKELDKAVECYSSAAELQPENHVIWSNRSAAFLMKGELSPALSDAERCISLAPKWAKGYHRKATILRLSGLHSEASLFCQRGLLACSSEDPEALQALSELKTLCDKDYVAHRIAGRWEGKVSDELGGYEQALTFEPNFLMSIELMGRSQPASYRLDTNNTPTLLQIDLISANGSSAVVPYIIELLEEDGQALLKMCCPFLSTEIPTTFEGPGLVLMRRGGEGRENLDTVEMEIPSDPREQLLTYMTLFTDLVKQASLDIDPVPGEDEEKIANRKSLKMISLHLKVDQMQKKFPASVVEQAVELVITGSTSDPQISSVALKMRTSMLEKGLITESMIQEARNEFEKRSQKDRKIGDHIPPVNERTGNERLNETRKRLQRKLVERRRKKAENFDISPPESPQDSPKETNQSDIHENTTSQVIESLLNTKGRKLSSIQEEKLETKSDLLIVSVVTAVAAAAAIGALFWFKRTKE